ncbi:MAG: hypothetical protein GXO73_04020 [Calditrichaeota bacterium]|nr:hypothetical protein [Calditrichota bacterium]
MTKWNHLFADAFVSAEAEIGVSVEVGPGAVVHSGVRLGDHVQVGPHCVIGQDSQGKSDSTTIGAGAIIRSHSVVYSGVVLGPQLETGHHVVIRDGTIAGENLRIGNFSDIEGQCSIGDYCRFHGYVHIGRGSTIGDFVWLYSLVTVTNDPLPPSEIFEPVSIDHGAVVCVGATIMPGTHIGIGAFVCAGTIARGEIPTGAVVAGPDGSVVNHVKRLVHLGTGLQHPWMNHFRRGFPEDCNERLEALRREILASCVEDDFLGGRR